ncbi:YhcN/YlaJ family sporulation lipoprotein [Rossellomorea aquimaris]|uniref:YhcN/YlaJ family sporulation lipoprotein n=1 Tax=Rossellomorea aquimaris TaxID=189382 RepID=UPI001CD1A886|nr:YhcN/YlaJ family sporulation lipoprotein [Rossellomorea aquimaris]MCA1055541.1 YhcN/YlaJ family sporulation lipoprotein [Rossellomorea aquimaris]
MFHLNKYILGTTVLSFALLGTACSGIDKANEEMFHDNGNTINVNDQEELYNENVSKDSMKNGEDFGYVRQQKSPIQGQTISNKNMYRLDREKVADSISKMSVAIPNVEDCATLVTDEEVLISYKTDKKDKDARFNVADQVKKTAMSVIPRWYHVYVTDDPNLMQNVENLAKMDSDSNNVNTAIDDTIDQMLKASPQGKDIDAGENANGEMIDEQYMGEDDVHQINKNRQKRNDTTGSMMD